MLCLLCLMFNNICFMNILNSERMPNFETMDGDLCLADSASTHTIIKDKKYFSSLKIRNYAGSVSTISGNAKIIMGSGRAKFSMPGGTIFEISYALYSPKSHRNLLSFKDIRRNGYHIETMNKDGIEFLCIKSERKHILEELRMLSSGLYCTKITMTESYAVVNMKFTDTFKIWHERLGHPGSVMMRKIVQNSNGHPLKNGKILQTGEFTCNACSQGKLITRPSPAKVGNESPMFLERIHGDICGPIHPPCGPFKYFMVLIDASSRCQVCLF